LSFRQRRSRAKTPPFSLELIGLLEELRSRCEQTVIVEYVNVHEGGQAIVEPLPPASRSNESSGAEARHTFNSHPFHRTGKKAKPELRIAAKRVRGGDTC
jgi:hypothetical protein